MMRGLYLEYTDQAADYGFKEWHKSGSSEGKGDDFSKEEVGRKG